MLHAPDLDPNWNWIVLFLFIGNAATHGPADRHAVYTEVWPAFAAGALIQLGEYTFVGLVLALRARMSVLYIVTAGFHGLFGIHAYLRLMGLKDGVEDGDYTEEIYS